MAGFAVMDFLFVILGFIIIGLISYFAFNRILNGTTTSPQSHASASAPTTTNKTNPYAVLSPALVPSKTAECSQQITFASDGNSSPVKCNNGDLNVLEWNALATLEPTVLTLGYNATSSQVQAALCADVKSSEADANTNNASVIEGTVYQIAALYYGWNFSPDPSVVLTNGTC